MADIGKYIPFLLSVEGGCVPKGGETYEEAFDRCRQRAWCCDPADTGGSTQMGLTLAAYRSYRRAIGQEVTTKADLQAISFDTWFSIVHLMCWKPLWCDHMLFNGPALMIADWYWHSGPSAIRRLQRLFNELGAVSENVKYARPLEVDGIFGQRTYNALRRICTTRDRMFTLLEYLLEARQQHFHDICARRPASQKFLAGWQNRANRLYEAALVADPIRNFN